MAKKETTEVLSQEEFDALTKEAQKFHAIYQLLLAIYKKLEK
jgi:hypothetical protein